jgi:transcriptional regulator with XRE-family HTH domain
MKLVEARRLRLLSQRELASEAGVVPKTVSNIESGRGNPLLSTIRKLAAALEMDALDIEEFRAVILGKEMTPANVA